MSNIEVKHLLRNNRFTENEWQFVSLLVYLPVGIILFILRGVLALNVFLLGSTLPDAPLVRKIINKIACLSLGISVTVENIDKKENADVYISNSLSFFDNLAVHSVTKSVSPGLSLQPLIAKSLGIRNFGNPINFERFKHNVTSIVAEEKSPLYFTPEEKSTNGKALLKFKAYPFSFSSKIQPICISIERPFLDISLYSLGSSLWTDVFFYMFSPLTNYKLKFLESLEKKSLTDEEFAEMTRQNIAGALKIEAVDITAHDLLEWEKRQVVEQRRIRAQQTITDTLGNPAVRRMASQVKEVLPHVPLDVIYRDLYRTRNVDNTITNILEGRITFIPEQSTSINRGSPTPSTSSTSNSSLSSSSSSIHKAASLGTALMFNTAASTFSKSAQDRSRSFQERKEQLIANARQRYIEKHNLDIPC